MNPNLQRLQPYPFQKLNQLFSGLIPADKTRIPLSIGEPKHEPPGFVIQALHDNLDTLSSYPATRGLDTLRETIANWLRGRFNLEQIDAHLTELLQLPA